MKSTRFFEQNLSTRPYGELAGTKRKITRIYFGALLILGHLSVSATPVDVTTLGVIANDNISDSLAIATALAGNTELYFPPGTYKLSSTVYIPSNRTIEGAGPNETQFVLGIDTVAFRVDGASNVYMQGFSIERPFDNSRDELIFVYNNASYVRLENVHTINGRSRAPALSFGYTSHCSVRNCAAIDNMRNIFEDGQNQVYGSGITMASSDDIVIEFCDVSETRNLANPDNPYFNYFQAGSIQSSGSTNGRIEYNHVSIAGQAIDNGGTTNTLVRGNDLDNIHSIGIKLVNGSYGAKVVGNYVSRAGMIGISLGPGNTELPIVNCLVDNNTITGVGKGIGQDWWDGFFSGTTPSGIHIDSPNIASGRCHDDTITNNTFYDNDQMVFGFINRPSDLDGYNITASNNTLSTAPAPSRPLMPLPRAVGIPMSAVNATETAGQGIWNAGDQYERRNMMLNQDSAPADSRWSFLMDMTSVTLVSSVALYGDAVYRAEESSPGGTVQIEAATTRYGDYTVIGSRTFGGDRETNPFTGGKGKRIPVIPAMARYLRISGGPWNAGFDNHVIVSEVLVNPRVVLDNYAPLHNPNVALPNPANAPQQVTFDEGQAFEGERMAFSLVDGKSNSGANPLHRLTTTLDLARDVNSSPTVSGFILSAFESDYSLLPKTGIVKGSSTGDPSNMDLILTSFDVAQVNGKVIIPLPVPRQGRYFQLQFLTNQTGSSAEDQQRIGEIDYYGSFSSDSRVEDWVPFD